MRLYKNAKCIKRGVCAMYYPDVPALEPDELNLLCNEYMEHNATLDPHLADQMGVKRGLRNLDGTGVLAGITNVSNVIGYDKKPDGTIAPIPGRLVRPPRGGSGVCEPHHPPRLPVRRPPASVCGAGREIRYIPGATASSTFPLRIPLHFPAIFGIVFPVFIATRRFLCLNAPTKEKNGWLCSW